MKSDIDKEAAAKIGECLQESFSQYLCKGTELPNCTSEGILKSVIKTFSELGYDCELGEPHLVGLSSKKHLQYSKGLGWRLAETTVYFKSLRVGKVWIKNNQGLLLLDAKVPGVVSTTQIQGTFCYGG